MAQSLFANILAFAKGYKPCIMQECFTVLVDSLDSNKTFNS